MTYPEPPGPGGKAPIHQKTALETASKKKYADISNAEIAPAENAQDIIYNQLPGLLEKGIKEVGQSAEYYAKNHGFKRVIHVDEDVTRVLLSSIKPSQSDESYKNESSEYQAKEFQKVLDGKLTGHDIEYLGIRQEDYYPLLVNRKTGIVLDGNHRYYALSKTKSSYAVVLFIDVK